jgi:hypothetical protein
VTLSFLTTEDVLFRRINDRHLQDNFHRSSTVFSVQNPLTKSIDRPSRAIILSAYNDRLTARDAPFARNIEVLQHRKRRQPAAPLRSSASASIIFFLYTQQCTPTASHQIDPLWLRRDHRMEHRCPSVTRRHYVRYCADKSA